MYDWLALRPCKAFGHTRPASVPGLNVGLPPSPRLGLRPKQGCFGCLPKVLHDAKPTEQATLNTHFQKNIVFKPLFYYCFYLLLSEIIVFFVVFSFIFNRSIFKNRYFLLASFKVFLLLFFNCSNKSEGLYLNI